MISFLYKAEKDFFKISLCTFTIVAAQISIDISFLAVLFCKLLQGRGKV
jgi:hypothetical protein